MKEFLQDVLEAGAGVVTLLGCIVGAYFLLWMIGG